MIKPLAACTALALALPAAAAPSSTLQGVYSEAQAARGAESYRQNCAQCHGAGLAGSFETPGLRGSLVSRWTGATLDLLFGYVSTAMPLQAPGALAPDIYADIVAYVLKANGLPAGAQALPADPAALRGIVFRGSGKVE